MKEVQPGNPKAPRRHPDTGTPLSKSMTFVFKREYFSLFNDHRIGRWRCVRAFEIMPHLDERPLPDEAKNALCLPLAPEVLKYAKK